MKSAQRLQNAVLVFAWVWFLSAGQARPVQAFPGSAPLAAPTIQSLIDAAPENGTVNIPAGTYSETLTINKHLTLLGASMNTTILQPALAGQRVITVAAGKNLSLENLKITGGQAAGNSGGGRVSAGWHPDGHFMLDHHEFGRLRGWNLPGRRRK